MNKRLMDITPYIIEKYDSVGTIDIANTPATIHVTCEPWHYIRTTQEASLCIDDNPVATMRLLSLKNFLAHPPIFKIVKEDYFQPNKLYRISIDVVEPDGSETPNRSRSGSLSVTT